MTNRNVCPVCTMGFALLVAAGSLDARPALHQKADPTHWAPQTRSAQTRTPSDGVAVVPGAGLFAREGETIYDSLCITDEDFYENAFGATCGGEDVFGAAYDLQAADDFVITEPRKIIAVSADYLTFSGDCPSFLCVQFFEDLDCMAQEQPFWSTEATVLSCEDIPNYSGQLNPMRYTAVIEECLLPPGRWWISIQPRMGDWGWWFTRYGNAPCGGSAECDALLRDGGERNPCCDGNPGYGFFDWTRSSEYTGGKHATLAMRVVAQSGTPRGCCLPDGSCRNLSPDDCERLAGTWQEGRLCDDVECPQPAACCDPAGGCSMLTRDDCLAARGRWHEGFDCGTFDCPKPGACCFDDGTCRDLDESSCNARGGEWSYEGLCAETGCPHVRGACCTESFFCGERIERECERVGGAFAGIGTTCPEACHWCRNVLRFESTCNEGGRMRFRVRYRTGFDGQSCQIAIDGYQYEFLIADDRVKGVYSVSSGEHTVTLVRPDCGSVALTCP